ncbi:MAG: D-aminoacylase [Planctomycetota bacterium]|nr:MAG: D-aminoacylase [Planctomycetota bacterium]
MYFDWILRGGWVIDGSGALPYRADVAITDTQIGDIGRLDDARGVQELDVTGHYIVPGFIDAHVHGDLMMLADTERVALACLRQGVTTLINGQDGSAFAPASPPVMDHMRRYTVGFNGNPPNLNYNWSGYDDYFQRFLRTTPLNMAYLIPNGNVRMEVMGLAERKPSGDELNQMKTLVREGMDAGSVGLSTGLDYIPSLYADADELAELCKEIRNAGGVYVTHMRGYGPKAEIGMKEVFEICRKSDCPGHISHYNGPADVLLRLMDQGRAEGLDLTFDTYPYLRGSTILAMVALPGWVQLGGVDATMERLSDKKVVDQLEREWFNTGTPYPLETTTIAMVEHPDWLWTTGKTVTEAAAIAGTTPGRLTCEILVANKMAVGIVGYRAGDRTEADMRAILRHPAHMAGSDGIYRGQHPHPRGWGAFARFLSLHTRELADYDWAEAITHLSAHAARRYRLTDRGLIRTGFAADIAVFDPLTVQDHATYENPTALATGVPHVWVNGTCVLKHGELTGLNSGRVLRRG